MRWYQHPPTILRMLFPGLVWTMPADTGKIYLTLDDGPNPVTTPMVLDLLGEQGIKATFFCTGQRAEKYTGLVERIRKEGHALGNHGYNHLDGWKTSTRSYLEDVEKADRWIGSRLFRPPYGRLRYSQMRTLKEKYTIVMWSWMTRDYEGEGTPQERLTSYLQPGYIYLFHDTASANRTMMNAIPALLSLAQKNRIEWDTLPMGY